MLGWSGVYFKYTPPMNMTGSVRQKIIDYTAKLALALKIKGLINIQFIEYNGELYVIEVNPRSSRTVPFISKVTGVPLIELAIRAMLGQKLKDLGYGTGLRPAKNTVAVKVPVFSFDKLPLTEVSLGPEMKSTGEVLGMADSLPEALYKGFTGAGYNFPVKGTVLLAVADVYKYEAVAVAKELIDLGFNVLATEGTAKVLNMNGIQAETINKLSRSGCIYNALKAGKIDLIINIPTHGRVPERDGFKIRRMAVENSIPCLTSLDTARAFIEAIKMNVKGKEPGVACLNDI